MDSRMPYGSQRPGSSSTKALLEKASAQLRGERFKNTASESKDDEINEYLSTLTKKPTAEPQWDRFGEVDDLIEDEGGNVAVPASVVSSTLGKGSAFLKKPLSSQQQATDQGVKESRQPLSTGTPLTVGEIVKKVAQKDDPRSTQPKYGSGSTRAPVTQMSDSDADLSLSLDEEVLRDVERRKKKPVVKPSATKDGLMNSGPTSRSSKLKPEREISTDDASLSSPTQVGRFPASQFLKKKPSAEVPSSMIPEVSEGRARKTSPKGEGKSLASSQHHTRNMNRLPVDTDDESLAEYIEGMSSASSASGLMSPRKKSKSPMRSPRKPKSTASTKTSPDRQIIHYEEPISESESDNFKINLQELDALDYVDDNSSSPSPSRVSPRKSTPFKVQRSSSLDGREKSDATNDTKNNNKPTKKKERDDVLEKFGIRSVDELFDDEDSDEMRIPEALEESDYDLGPLPSRAVVSPKPPLRSILSPTPRSVTPRSSRSRVRLMDELIEVRSRSPSPEVVQTGRSRRSGSRGSRGRGRSSSVSSELIEEEEKRPSSRAESESAIQTAYESETDAASSVRSDSESESSRRSRSDRRVAGSRRRSSGASSSYSYSDDFTGEQSSRDNSPLSESQSTSQQWTYSYTDDDERSDVSIPVSTSRRSRHQKMKDSSVQTGLDTTTGLQYHWLSPVEREVLAGSQYGQAFVNPSSIAATVVSADTLEAMTAYSPATLALNDMLKMQLDLTKQFMSTQRRLYQSLMQSVDTTFHYTTLQDTKEYIRKHRKPRSSYNQILKEVKEEMGIA